MSRVDDQTSIVETVIRGFLPSQNRIERLDKLTTAVLSFANGSANKATARCEFRAALAEAKQEMEDERLELCLDTANTLACGHGNWLNSETTSDAYPAWELLPLYQRDELVDWTKRWQQNGGRTFPDGRMIALKNDPIWSRISAFHLPFPPFDLNSGMRVEGVGQAEVSELGLLDKNDRAELGSINFNFEEALRARVDFWFSEVGCRQRFEKKVERADAVQLLRMATERVDNDEEVDGKLVHEALFILARIFQRGLDENWEQQAKAYSLSAQAHDMLQQSEQAKTCRLRQLQALQSWISSGIPTDGDQRAKVLRQAADVCERLGQSEEARAFRQSAEDCRTGYSLFYEARQQVKDAGRMSERLALEVIRTLGQAFHRGFTNRIPDEVNAWGLLASAYQTLQDTEKVGDCRSGQLATLESCFASGIPQNLDRRGLAYGQAADICDEMGQSEKAAAFRELEYANRDALCLLKEALAELKACGDVIEKKAGSKILQKLTGAAKRIPEDQSERHAEIFQATGQVLAAWGNTAQAIEYYEYALQKNPKIRIKGRLEALRKSLTRYQR
jgi:tetratricopeptide (TPR) repeat protein